MLLHQVLVERVRAGTRYAVVHDWDNDPGAAATRIRNVVLYSDANSSSTGAGTFGVQPSMVSITREDPGGAGNDEGADRITVAINNFRFFFLTPGIAGAYRGKPISHSITVENLGAAP